MKRWLLMFAMVGLFCTGSAWAQLDPEDDGVGIYFDPCGCDHCVQLPPGQHIAWLIITHPTSPLGVHGWECRVEVTGPAFVLDWGLQGLAINADDPPDFRVGLAEPLVNPVTWPVVVVMEILFLINDLTGPVEFYLVPVYNPSIPDGLAYVDGGDITNLIEMRQSTGGPGEPVAVVNGDCPVPNETTTWGQVKCLYQK